MRSSNGRSPAASPLDRDRGGDGAVGASGRRGRSRRPCGRRRCRPRRSATSADELVVAAEQLLPVGVAVVLEVAGRVDDVGEDERHRHPRADVAAQKARRPARRRCGRRAGRRPSPPAPARASLPPRRRWRRTRGRAGRAVRARLVARVRVLPEPERPAQRAYGASGVVRGERDGSRGDRGGRVQRGRVVALCGRGELVGRRRCVVDRVCGDRDLDEGREEPSAPQRLADRRRARAGSTRARPSGFSRARRSSERPGSGSWPSSSAWSNASSAFARSPRRSRTSPTSA